MGSASRRKPSYDDLVRVIADLQTELKQVRSELAEARSEIAELKRRLAKDSSNSSKPPSSDGPFRKPPPRSQRKSSIPRFLHDPAVPFTNNQGEQDIRMVKVRMKASGGWRTLDGANHRLLVRSYLSTARKHGRNPLAVLRDLFAGNLWLPPLTA